jgi:hypothetical protein
MARLRPETHEAVRDETTTSAAIILPLVTSQQGAPQAVLDVGCGPEAVWLQEAARLWPEAQLLGLDLDEPTTQLDVRRWDAEAGDRLPLRPTGERWPLVLCLEVAEHLRERAGDHLVHELCQVAERVLWSAAIPDQGGDGHVNEQPPFYWGARFNAEGFYLSDPWRVALWSQPGVAPWYSQNLLLAQPAVLHHGTQGGAIATTPPPHLVHPAVFKSKADLAAWWRVEWTKTEAARAAAIEELRKAGARCDGRCAQGECVCEVAR